MLLPPDESDDTLPVIPRRGEQRRYGGVAKLGKAYLIMEVPMASRRLYLVAGKVTDSVTYGFLPAAGRLGLDVILLTDRPSEHERTYPRRNVEIVECDVTDFRDIINSVRSPDAIFSNSDHLQAPAALAAAYFGLPAKDWRAATRTKNKALMRRHLGDSGHDRGYVAELGDPGADLTGAPYPLVLKPREGVASEDVVLIAGPGELAARVAEIGHRRPLMVEEYLPGRLHTLETIGDGRELRVLGSFRTTLSPPPYFVEERLEWVPLPPDGDVVSQVLDQLRALGVGFGASHTEFVVHEGRARLIEVNYRNIGDHCDFLLADLLNVPLFDDVLRIHLGEPLTALTLGGGAPSTSASMSTSMSTSASGAAVPPAADRACHAIAEYVLADRSGTLVAAPEPGEFKRDGVLVTYRTQRPLGSTIALTHTNRDYLGTITAIGPHPAAVAAAIARFRAEHVWAIT
jgi:biotin carboxylase